MVINNKPRTVKVCFPVHRLLREASVEGVRDWMSDGQGVLKACAALTMFTLSDQGAEDWCSEDPWGRGSHS